MNQSVNRTCYKDKGKGNGKGLVQSWSAAYMNQTRDQKRFTISEVIGMS